jgi:hypothetical protein
MYDVSEVQAFQERFHVAASILIEAYADVRTRGYLADDPEIVAAALEDVKALIKVIDAPVTGQIHTFGGDAVLRLICEAERFHLHTCSCPYCPKGLDAPS